MIDVSALIANLDEVLGDNMFLKDARKADNLKGSVHDIFTDLNTRIDNIKLNYRIRQVKLFQTWKNLLNLKMPLNNILEIRLSLIDSC